MSAQLLKQELSNAGSRSEDTRSRAVTWVAQYFVQQARDLSGDEWARFQHELNARISELVNSSSAHEQLGGLALIAELTPLDCEDNASKLTNFANFLRLPIGSSADNMVLSVASR